MEKKELKGVATPEQIAGWKNLHGDVFTVEVGDRIGYLKRPDRATMAAATSIGEKEPMRFSEILLENCWLGGDEAIKREDRYFLAVLPQLDILVDFGVATLKKL